MITLIPKFSFPTHNILISTLRHTLQQQQKRQFSTQQQQYPTHSIAALARSLVETRRSGTFSTVALSSGDNASAGPQIYGMLHASITSK